MMDVPSEIATTSRKLNTNDPFRPPTTIHGDPVRVRAIPWTLVAGLSLWLILAVALWIAHLFIKPMLIDMDVELPVLTRWLMHPMAVFMFFAIVIAVLLTGTLAENRAQRKRTGALALMIGVIALMALVVGIVAPLVSVWTALS